MTKIFTALLLIVLSTTVLNGCNDAQIASHNISEASRNFEVNRRVVFFNGITDNYLLSVEGRCDIVADGMDKQLEVTCKTGHEAFKKHFLGLSDNVSYFVEQLDAQNVSTYHYRVIFKPAAIIPDIEVK